MAPAPPRGAHDNSTGFSAARARNGPRRVPALEVSRKYSFSPETGPVIKGMLG